MLASGFRNSTILFSLEATTALQMRSFCIVCNFIIFHLTHVSTSTSTSTLSRLAFPSDDNSDGDDERAVDDVLEDDKVRK